MTINYWSLAAQVIAEVASLKALQAGDSETLPTIHIKSGTTAVQISITVSEDAKK